MKIPLHLYLLRAGRPLYTLTSERHLRKYANLSSCNFCRNSVSSGMFFKSACSLTQSKNFCFSSSSIFSSHCCPRLAQIVLSGSNILNVNGANSPNVSNTNATKESTTRCVILFGTSLTAPQQTSRVSSSTFYCIPRSEGV